MTSPLDNVDPRGPRNTARAIVLRSSGEGPELLVMERWRRNEASGDMLHYITIPGGGIEADETPEQAAMREIEEETQVTIAVGALVAVVTQHNGARHSYFEGQYLSGEPGLHPRSEEAAHNSEDNRYIPQLRLLTALKQTDLHPVYQKIFPLIVEMGDGEVPSSPWLINEFDV